MRLKLFGFEVEIRRETTAERLERVIRERRSEPVALPEIGWWACRECGEYGMFAPVPSPGSDEFPVVWPSGYYDWRAYPEMRCACRLAEKVAKK